MISTVREGLALHSHTIRNNILPNHDFAPARAVVARDERTEEYPIGENSIQNGHTFFAPMGFLEANDTVVARNVLNQRDLFSSL